MNNGRVGDLRPGEDSNGSEPSKNEVPIGVEFSSSSVDVMTLSLLADPGFDIVSPDRFLGVVFISSWGGSRVMVRSFLLNG